MSRRSGVVSGRKAAAPAEFGELLALIAADIHAIREVLERVAAGAARTPFSTRRGQEPPEFVGRRKAWRATARTIPGATKSGRWWYVERATYAAWLASQATTATPTTLAPANDAGVPWTPRAALLSIGLRPTREGRK
jgi:hypothetical protein